MTPCYFSSLPSLFVSLFAFSHFSLGETGAALIRCKDIGKVLFIGSPQTGKRVMAVRSRRARIIIAF